MTKKIHRNTDNDPLIKALATSNNAQLLHGNRGLFSPAGDNQVLSLHVGHRGLADFLEAVQGNQDSPYFHVISGVGAAVGSEATSACSDAPVSYMKVGTLTARWGKIIVDTATIDRSEVGRRLNRGDFMDYVLINQQMNSNYRPNPANILNDMTAAEMYNAGVSMERKIAPMIWTGNAAIQSITGGYSEFAGLDNQISASQVDAISNAALTAANSEVINANYGNISNGGLDIVEPLEEMEDTIINKAYDQGVSLEAAIVMHPQMWHEVSSLWPIKYNTQNMPLIDQARGARLVIDARTNIEERDRMRQSRTLMLNGNPYPVILDTGITKRDSTSGVGLTNGQFASSIYFIPLSMNSIPATILEYRAQGLGVAGLADSLLPSTFWWTDDGKFLWSYDAQYTCFKLKLTVEMRVVLRAPQYAFKLQNVKYVRGNSPQVDPNPSSSYWRDGGVSIRAAATQYAAWL